MKTNLCVIFLCLFSFFEINAQTEKCSLEKSSFSELRTVNTEKAICLAQNSDKDITLFYVLADFCSGCKVQLPEAIKLSEEYNMDFYAVLGDPEHESSTIYKTLNLIHSYNKRLKTVIISDSLYSEANLKYVKKSRLIEIRGAKHWEKYRNFLTKITTPGFENVVCLPKYIAINKKGEVIFISDAYKDGNVSDKEAINKAIEMDRTMNKRVDN